MNNQKVYYKVVDGMCSTFAGYRYQKMYELNIPITGYNNRPVFIFDSIENARKYSICHRRIFKCIATKVRKPYTLVSNYTHAIDTYWEIVDKAKKSKKNINKALSNYNDKLVRLQSYGSFHKTIEGTLFADSVTLLEEVKKETI